MLASCLRYIGVLAVLLTGCVLSPTDAWLLESRSEPVFFQGYGTNPGSTIILKAKNHTTGQMEELARATTQTKAGIAANTWGQHPALYYWSVTAPVAASSAQYNRWRIKPCDDTNPTGTSAAGTGTSSSNLCILRYEAEVVVSEPSGQLKELWTFPEGGPACVADKLTNGEELLASAVSCSTGGALLRLESK